MRKILGTMLPLAGAIALAGCGGQQDSGEQAPSQAAPETQAEANASPEPETEAAVEDVALADLTGDAAAGKQVFTKCMSCHVIEEGVNRTGPHLYDVVGRTAGSVEGFNYSDANKNSGITWTRETLFEYLEDPQDYLKGTRMMFPGIKDPQDRADLIEYLDANGAS